MLKWPITYKDFDGNEREETLYFNLTQAELMEMELGTSGGMKQLLEKIVNEKDQPRLIEMFKMIILKSYGEKSLDGKYFRKSEQITSDFTATAAYNDLFMKLATDADEASKFINGIIPESLKEEAATAENKAKLAPVT